MIHFKSKFKQFDWTIELFIVTKNVDVDAIQIALEKTNCPLYTIHKSFRLLTEGINSGFAYTNNDLRKSILVINASSSADEYINTFAHEKNHIEMHICDFYKIDPVSEEAACLSGELAQLLIVPMIAGLLAEIL